jgi:GNAT superfamily N-acetyltransferase
MLKVIPLREEHLEDAAILVSHRYRRLCEQEAHLTNRYTEVTRLLPLLKEIFSASGVGMAAMRGSQLVGFLTGWQMPSFRGKKSTYSPEWANGAALEDSPRIYEELYSHLAADWVADGYIAHYISLFSNDIAALKSWHWMGFGMVAIDAIRGLDSIPGCDVNVQIRRAEIQDLEVVIELQKALWLYSKGSPIFLLSENRERSYYEEWLGNPRKVVWLAYWNGEPVSFMRLGPANDDVSTIIVDEKTTSIYGAFTKEEVRKAGIATALLDRALEWARDSGYERCAVDFEPMNLLGSRFWLKYFKPVCSSVFRHIDDRVTQGADSSTGRLSIGTGHSSNSANTHPVSPSLVWTWSQSPA